MNQNKTIPSDPVILLSYLNTQLRDFYPSLEELCSTLGLDQKDIEQKLHEIDYDYNIEQNKFI